MEEGLRFPDEFTEQETLNTGDYMLIADSSDGKKAKWFSLTRLYNWLRSFFVAIDASNLGTSSSDWQTALGIAVLKGSINDAAGLSAYDISDNGYYKTDATTTNIPDTNKDGLLSVVIADAIKFLKYQTVVSNHVENWQNSYYGTTWGSWEIYGTSSANLSDEFAIHVNAAGEIDLLDEKTSLDDADIFIGENSTSSPAQMEKFKVTWTNIKATLKTYFDTIYLAAGSFLTSSHYPWTTSGHTGTPNRFAAFAPGTSGEAVEITEPIFSNIKYGRYYNWYAVSNEDFAPSGWHVPTQADWETLLDEIDTYDEGDDEWPVAGNLLKDTELLYWESVGTNQYNFSAKGSGERGTGIRSFANYWTATEGVRARIYGNAVIITDGEVLTDGYCVCLVKDNSTDPGFLEDIDGNVYRTVKIGSQVWVVHWACTKLNDDTPIPEILDNDEWDSTSDEAYCNYLNDLSYTFKVPPNINHASQIITVGKSGCDYTSIQDAIDSITDATTIKRYCIYIYPGIYNENIICKNYVDIIGSGRTNTIISATSGIVVTFPSTKCIVSGLGIVIDYGTITADSSAIISPGVDVSLKDCDITVTKTAGDYLMRAIEIVGGSFRMSDCYINYFNNTEAAGAYLVQSAILQSGTLSDVILNNNEIIMSTINPNNDIVGFETTANVEGSCIFSNNFINIDTAEYAASATGLLLYGTGTSAIFLQNRIVINCDAFAYGFWIDSSGGAIIDSKYNEIILTSVGVSVGCKIAIGDIWNSTFDKITAKTTYSGISTGIGTVHFASSYNDGNFIVTGQLIPGSKIETFSASKVIDFDNGNVQEMVVTDDTTISIDNELPAGTYILYLNIDTGTPPDITLDASFGTPIDDSKALLTGDGDENIVNILVKPSGLVRYGINTVTA